jgi:hypothetical protein
MKGVVRLLPLILALVGAGAGVCGAMLYWQDPGERARVHLDASLPLALVGLLGGAAVGGAAAAICARRPRLIPAAGVGAAALLGAAFAAPLGWIVGDMGAERLAREGMAVGAGVGAALGLVVGLIQGRLDLRTPGGAACSDSAVPGYQDRPDGIDPPRAAEPPVAPDPRVADDGVLSPPGPAGG